MEAWQKGAPVVLKMSSAAKQKYFQKFPDRLDWFQRNHPEHFGHSVTQSTVSLKKTTDAKIVAQKIADMRYKKALQDSSERVKEMGKRRRESGEGLGGGLESNKDIVSHVKQYGSIKAGRLGGDLYEDKQMTHAKTLAEQMIAKKAAELFEEPQSEADAGEYDYEGDMAKSQLRSILHNAKMLHDMLEDNTNLPEWVQSKITLAEDYILTAANYMRGELKEMDEEVELDEEEIATLSEAKMTTAQMKKREKIVKGMKPISDWESRYPGRGKKVMYATATKMAMKEEVEQIDEGKYEDSRTHWETHVAPVWEKHGLSPKFAKAVDAHVKKHGDSQVWNYHGSAGGAYPHWFDSKKGEVKPLRKKSGYEIAESWEISDEEVEQIDEANKTKKEKLKKLLYRNRSNVRELGKGAGLTAAQKAAARKAIAK